MRPWLWYGGLVGAWLVAHHAFAQGDFVWTRPVAEGNGNWGYPGNWAGAGGQIPDDPNERAVFNDPATNGMPIQTAAMSSGLGQLRFNFAGWTVYAEDPLRFNSGPYYQSVAIEARAQGGPGSITVYPEIQLLNSRQIFATDSGAILVLAGYLSGSYAPIISSLSPAGPDTGAVLIRSQNFINDPLLVRQGTLLVAHSSALGASAAAVLLGDAETAPSARMALLVFTNGITVPKPIVVTNRGASAALGGIHTSGSSTFSSTVTVYRATELWAAGSGTVTFAGPLNGPGALTKTGTGTVVLSGANAFSGVLTVGQGTLRLGSVDALPSGASVMLASQPDALLDLNNNGVSLSYLGGGGQVHLGNASLTLASGHYSGQVSGAGGLVKTSDSTLILAGTNTYIGGTWVQGGTLRLGSAHALPAIGAIVLANAPGVQLDLNNYSIVLDALSGGGTSGGEVLLGNASLTVSNGNFAGSIQGNGGLIKAGSGTLQLSGSNTFVGGTVVEGGTVRLGSPAALPSGTALTLASSSSVVLDLAGHNVAVGSLSGGGAAGGQIWATNAVFAVESGSFGGTMLGGALVKVGAGTLVLSGANYPEGGVTISNGILRLGSAAALPHGVNVTLANVASDQLDLDGYNLTVGNLQGGRAQGGNISLGGARLSVHSGTYSGQITGNGELVKVGTGTLVLDADQDFEGSVKIEAGTLQIGSGGTSGSLKGNIENHGLLVIARAGTIELTQKITGSGNLKKTGSGTLTLSGTCNYTGETLLEQGTLLIQSTSGWGRVVVAPTGALSPRLGGTGLIRGPLEVGVNGIVAPGTSIGTLTVQNDATIAGTLEIELKQNQCDRLDVAHILDIQNATVNFVRVGSLSTSVYVFASYGTLVGEFASVQGLPPGMSIDYNYNGLNQIALVPEPMVVALWLTGAVLLSRLRRANHASSEG